MAAFSREDGNKVWQKVNMALANADPAIRAAVKELKSQIAANKSNPQLQFLPFTEAQAIVNLGTQLGSGAAKLHLVYVKKNGTSGSGTGTDSFASVHDAADNSSSATVIACVALLVANDERLVYDAKGLPVATGAVISMATAPGGATESTANDGGNGFIVIS